MSILHSIYHIRLYLGMLIVIVGFFEKAYAQSENEQITISPGESVQLNAFSEGTTYYLWLRNNEVIENATNSVYSVTKEGIYKAIAYNDYNCGSELSNNIEVRYSKTSEEFTALHFCEKAKPTIMELDIGVSDLIWYSTKERNVSLPATTLLEDGKMYYASSLSSEVSYAVEVFMDACIDIAIQKEVDKVQKEISQLSSATGDVAKAKKELRSARKSREDLTEKKLEYVEERTYNEVIGEMLKDTGIKTKVIKQYLPVMNRLINQYLQILDFFVAFHLDENFNETIRSRHRDSFNYSSFSEGEKQRIDLSLLFTWRQIAKLKNSAATNLLVLDETFDSSA